MKTKFLIFIASVGLLVLIPNAYASENLFYGTSSLERFPTTIIPNESEIIEIKFHYNQGPYSLDVEPIFDVNPKEATSFVEIEFEPVESIVRKSIARMYGTITVDPNIPSEKIFLSISYDGIYSISPPENFKSAWSDTAIINIKKNLVPEPQQDIPVYENCGPGVILQDGICVVEKIQYSTETFSDPSNCWGGPACNYDVRSPHKQFKSGIQFNEIQCKESLTLVIKHDYSPACVTSETKTKLTERGWIKIQNVKRDSMLSAGYKLYPGVGWTNPDEQKNIPEPIYIENPNNTNEQILNIDSMMQIKKILDYCVNGGEDKFMESDNGTHYINNNNCEWGKMHIR